MLWTLYHVHRVSINELIIPAAFGVLLCITSAVMLMTRISYKGFFQAKSNRILLASCSLSASFMVVVAMLLMPFTSTFSFELIFFRKLTILYFVILLLIFYPIVRSKLE